MDSTRIVGEKIKSLRETKEISVAELAERSGLAEEQINRIENNVDLPSLAPLIKIARALGVRLGTFLDDQEEQGAVVCRKESAEDTISFSNNAMDLRTHMRYHSLSKSKADRHMEPFIVDVASNDNVEFTLSSHEGEEFIYVMEGVVDADSKVKNTEVEVFKLDDGKNFVVTSGLNPGDRIVIEGVGTLRDGTQIQPITPEAAAAKIKAATQPVNK